MPTHAARFFYRLALITVILKVGSAPGIARSQELQIKGEVRSPSGYYLEDVEVGVQETDMVTQSDENGRFVLTIGPEILGTDASRITLLAVYPGFEPVFQTFDLSLGVPELEFIMAPTAVGEVITVHERAPSATEQPGAPHPVDFLDIVATAGAYADPLYAAQMLPGVAKVDDGAGLFVRGGDVSETATYFDRALLDHPFRSETPTGGFFGAVDAMQIRGFQLSTGAFPARYGNALSAVLELEGRGIPEHNSLQVNVGLATSGFLVERTLGSSFGLRLALSRVDTRPLIELNQPELDFLEPPTGGSMSLSLYHDHERYGSFQISAISDDSQVTTELESRNFAGALASADRNRRTSLAWQRAFGVSGEVSVTLARSSFENQLEVGVLDIDKREEADRARVDLSGRLRGWIARGGAEWERLDHRSVGHLPTVGSDLGGVQGTRLWDQAARRRRQGGYVELERDFGRWTTHLGLRADHFGELGEFSVEPRAALLFRPAREHRLRLAWGLYRQAPALEYLGDDFGNPDLGLLEARHWVLGYEYGQDKGPVHLRAEVYDKSYDGLPLENAATYFDDSGYGAARGLDLYVALDRGGRWRGWVGYSYLEARRLYTPWELRGEYAVPEQPYAPAFEVPHSLQLVLHHELPWAITLGTTLRVASGRPYTPVIGAEALEEGFRPVYGGIHSERFPSSQRIDLSASRPFIVGPAVAQVYIGINDVLDDPGVNRYVYSEDFSQRRPARTSFGRTFYLGVTLHR